MSFFVGITTCDRPWGVHDVLMQLPPYAPQRPRVHVVDDTGFASHPLGGLLERTRELLAITPYWTFSQHAERYGKERFWKTYNELLALFLSGDSDYFVSLPDDCEIASVVGPPPKGFFRWLEKFLERAPVVNFHRDTGRIFHGQWGSPMPALAPWKVELDGKWMGADIVGWVDGFTAMHRHVAEDIYPLAPITRRWDLNPELGSGVGAQITARLAKHGHQVVRPHKSLVRHLPGPSIMNPAAREKHPLATVDFIDDPDRD